MIRCRFRANVNDFRPVNWPIKHPYWCTGYGGGSIVDDELKLGYAIIVAYADDEAEILRNWPEATHLDSEERTEYTFTDRFPKPDWFNP